MAKSIYRKFTGTLIAVLIITGCSPVFDHQVTIEELEETMTFLASDTLKGRLPGTPEDAVLTAYIIEKLDQSGMVLLGDKGKQPVMIEQGAIITSNNRLFTGTEKEVWAEGEKLTVPGFSATDTVTGELYLAHELTGELHTNPGSILAFPLPDDLPSSGFDAYKALRSQCLEASDNGAAAVVIVYNDSFPDIESPSRLPLPIPVVAMESGLFNQGIETGTIQDPEAILFTAGTKPQSAGLQVQVETEVVPGELITHNTMAALIGGDPAVKDEYIIIGAHHDHLGMGGRGTSSRRQDTVAIHYGADDNASGVAAVIELAQHLLSRSPDRSFVFTTFTAEEMGLQGSRAFAEDPPVDLGQVQAMINMDMIGRLNDKRQLQVGGVGTSPIFRELIDSVNQNYKFNIAYSEAGYGPSDHSSFYAKDVPVLFISTGAHTDYHTPDDNLEGINYAGMQEVISFISDLALALGNLPQKIEFTLAGPKESSGSRGRYDGKVTFGLMPDMMYDGNEGMPVSFVTEGKPAAIGGMKNGDVITAVDGKIVGNVYDYMERLSDLVPGQSVIVTVERKGETLDLLLKL